MQVLYIAYLYPKQGTEETGHGGDKWEDRNEMPHALPGLPVGDQ